MTEKGTLKSSAFAPSGSGISLHIFIILFNYLFIFVFLDNTPNRLNESQSANVFIYKSLFYTCKITKFRQRMRQKYGNNTIGCLIAHGYLFQISTII